jgi:hypothetical protein
LYLDLDLRLLHISALTIAARRLWIGTVHGFILSVPFWDADSDTLPMLGEVQLSLHAFQDAVKFFLHFADGKDQIITAGDGYIDLRLPQTAEHSSLSHLIVWQTSTVG